MATRTYIELELDMDTPCSRDRFKRWALAYGIEKLSRSLNIGPRTIYRWFATPNSVTPINATVWMIIRLSEEVPCGVGRLEFEDICGLPKIRSRIERSYGYKSMIAPRQIPTRRAY